MYIQDKKVLLSFIKNVPIVITCVWIGFLGAISFMESWLKFEAPNLSLAVGLEIGALVFAALNKVEILFSIILIISIIALKNSKFSIQFLYPFYIAIVILMLQSFWLLPTLNERALLIIQGIEVVESKLHVTYVIMEVLKVIGLLIFGVKQLNSR